MPLRLTASTIILALLSATASCFPDRQLVWSWGRDLADLELDDPRSEVWRASESNPLGGSVLVEWQHTDGKTWYFRRERHDSRSLCGGTRVLEEVSVMSPSCWDGLQPEIDASGFMDPVDVGRQEKELFPASFTIMDNSYFTIESIRDGQVREAHFPMSWDEPSRLEHLARVLIGGGRSLPGCTRTRDVRIRR